MAKQLGQLTDKLIRFIEDQKIFFVATAMADGRINLSPKGMDSFRVMDPQSILWLNLTGSGNETATHLLHHDRMTIMFCAFDGKPLILRLYGRAKVYHQRESFWQDHIHLFQYNDGGRQLIEMDIELVQTSCGFGVPLMEFQEERDLLKTWTENKGPEGVRDYQLEKNAISLDGHPTNILDE